MTEAFDIEALRRKLSSIMERKGVKPTTLSLRVSKSPTLVRDLLEKTSDTKLSTLYRLANELGVPVGDLISDEISAASAGPRLFVKGDVSAGVWKDAFEWDRDDWQTMPGRSDISYSSDLRFFLRVQGDSMDLLYPPGTFIECVSVFADIDIQPGKRVVVLRTRADQQVEATVKELVQVENDLWLVPRSTNPVHQGFALGEHDDDIVESRIIAVVVASVRPE